MLNIYNSALAKLGSNRLEQVRDVDEPGTVGSLCRLLLPQVLELALDYAPWSFALARAALKAESQNRGSRYPYGFSLPDDLIRPVRLGTEEPGFPFIIEGQTIFAPVARAELLYVKRQEDSSLWTASFTQAVTIGLASELCPAVLNDISRQQLYRQEFQAALAHAAAADLKRQKFQPGQAEWLGARG